MKKLLSICLSIAAFGSLYSQNSVVGKDNVVRNPDDITVTFTGETQPWRSIVIDTTAILPITKTVKLGYHPKGDWVLNETVNPNALPKNGDEALQKDYSTGTHRSTQIGNWQGITTNTSPGDPAMDVGPNHVVQMMNGTSGARVQIWDKTGTSLLGPSNFSALAGTTPGGGDPIVLYDERADRWMLTEFSNGGVSMYIAISTSPDPLGTYFTYTVTANSFPDYPKYSIWDNTYLITANEGTGTSSVYALDRTSMLTGVATNAQRFTIPRFGTIGFQAATPVSLMGTTTAGTPPMLMRMRDDAWAGSASDALEIWELDIDWSNPGAATLTQTNTIATTPHESELCGYTSFACIPQQGSGTTLDPLRELLMNRIMYRNFGTHESIVCAHVTDVNGADLAGIRWYELRRTGGGAGTWAIYQESTYSPDSDMRWMPTIGISASGNIGLAYNVSSSSMYPSIRYTGRKECDPLNVMTETEVTLVAGTSPNNSNRWGDYNAMGIDPTDGETFWFTAMYNPATQARTRIGAFKIDPCNPEVQFTSATYTVNEGDANVANGCLDYYIVNVPIQIGIDPTQPADITINVTGGTATQGVDYDISNTTFTLDGTTLVGTAEIWVYNDNNTEGNETITLDYTLNANGGNAITGSLNQTVTITINDDDLAPTAMTNTVTILTEDFEAGFGGFSTVNPSGDTPWQIGNNAAASSGAYAVPVSNTTDFAWINDDACNCTQNDVDLIFPSVDLTGYTSANLSFYTYFEDNTYNGDNENADLTVSIGGGAFVTVGALTASTIDGAWITQNFDISAYVGNANVVFAINYSDATGWLYGCTVDDVIMTGTVPIDIQTAVNTGSGMQANLGPNETVHFYDPASNDVMLSLVNTSTFDYGCVTVDVDRDGSTPTALPFASAVTADFLHSKTYTVVPTNSNPTGTFDVTLYYKEAEVTAWETTTGNSRNDLEIIKVAGNNRINDVTPGNYTGFTINNVAASLGTFNSDVTLTSSFTNGFSGFGAGIYNVSTVTVTHTTVDVNPSCNGLSDGSITVTASGGTGPYTYSINGGTTFQSSNIFNGLAAGTYSVVAMDAGANQSTAANAVLTDPSAISVSSSSVNATCGASNGAITIVASGGTGTLQYSIDGGTTFQGSGSFTGLSVNTYSIVVQDANSCQAISSETITNTSGPSITSATAVDADCNGGSTGTITIVATGGTGALQYSIDGGTTFQGTGSFTGLAANTYNIVVQDANNCQATSTATVGEPAVISISSASTNATCGSNNGAITITASGGTGTLQYSIDGGTTFQGSGSFTGLAANTYSLIVQDANNCQVSSSETVGTSAGPAITSSTAVDADCNGAATGSITVVASGGTGALQYSVDGGTTFQSTGTFAGLAANTYSIVVEDANGCQATTSTTVGEPTGMTLTLSSSPANCSSSDGSISISASGGQNPKTYSIDGGLTFQNNGNFNGLASGNYNIVVQDGNGCQSTGNVTVSNTSGPIISSTSKTDLNCNGGADGTISITATGTATLQYSIDGGTTFQTSNNFTGLTAGTYNIMVLDGNTCQTDGGTITLIQPSAISISSSATNESCSNSDGTITITASGGTGTLQYSIDGGTTFQGSGSFTGLSANTYSLVVQDANNCQVSSSETITNTSGPSITSATAVDADCNGASTGTITVVATGGTGALQYSIDGGTTFQGSGSFTGLSANTFSIVVQDANNCQATSTATVGEPAVISISSASTNASCGSNNGAITITASGGTGTLQYSIDGGTTFQGSGSFTGLAANTYSLTVQDANNCQVSSSETVGTSAGPAITSSTAVDADCNGAATGSITVVASGGTGALQYSVDGGTTFQSTGTFAGLAANTYSIVVEDANGCQATTSTTVGEPTGMTLTLSSSPANCSSSNGSISINASGGQNPKTYSIDGGLTFQNNGNFNGLTSGNYNVVVQDGNGCQSFGNVTVSNTSGPVITSASKVDVTCNGGSNGSITINATGAATLQYSIDGGATFQTGNSFTGLTAGTYNIMVLDGNTCQTAGGALIVGQPSAITVSSTSTNASCGNSDGTITITASGGTGTLQYSNDGGATFQAGNVFTGLSSTLYNLVVEDANSCQVTSNQTVGATTGPTFTSAATTDITCNGDADGTISIVASGTGTLQYSIDGGSTFVTSSSFTGLSANNYSIVVEDGNGCQVSGGNATISEPSVINISATGTDPSCNGDSDGSITITASGGTGTLQYSVDGGTTFQTINIFNGLTANSYAIVVEDDNNCTVSTSVTLTNPTGLTYTRTRTNVTCNGASTGTITFSASGGTAPIQYSIDGGSTYQSGNVFTGLAAGSYPLSVIDANGCVGTGSANVNITQPLALTLTTTSTNDNCGNSDGTITVTAAGGTGTILYSNNGGTTFQASNTFTGLAATTYNIVVQDDNNCQASTTQSVGSNGGPALSSINKTDASCNGAADGTITVNATGTAALLYSNDNGATFQTSNVFTGLTAGSYMIMVEDGNGCQTFAGTITVNQPAAINISSSSVNESCGASDGAITIVASGGVGTLQYSIDGGTTFQSTGTFTGLAAGGYNIVVEDANNCQNTTSESVSSNGGPSVSNVSNTSVSCNGGTDGSITITATGTATLTYSIDGGTTFQSSGTFTGLTAASYNVMVEDGNGCQTTGGSTTVGSPSAISITSTTVNENCGTSDGSVTISATGGTGTLQYSIDGGTTFQSTGTFTGLAAGAVNILVEDANSCQNTATTTIGSNGGPSISSTATVDETCFGSGDGTITITATGTATMQYSIDGGTTFSASPIFNSLSAGNYAIVIEDGNGCQTVGTTETVNSPTPITYTANNTNENCGANDGSITITASGNVGATTYSIDGGSTFQSSNIFTGLSSGNYAIVIEDAGGCQATGSESINSNGGPSIFNASSTDESCFGSGDGSIVIVASGGTGTLQYSFDGGATFQSGSNISNLSAGSYSVIVQDANGCSASNTVVVNAPNAITSTITSTDANCGANDGSATVTAIGGTGTLTYLWDDAGAQTTAIASGLSPGNYSVTITDANSCSITNSITVNSLGQATLTTTQTNVTCNGDSDGIATVTATGGQSPYTFAWNDAANQTTATANGLSAGIYSVDVTDNTGCVSTTSVTITEPAALNATINGIQTSCAQDNGIAMSAVTGGTPPYAYSWDDAAAQTTSTAINLSAGNYNLTVTDVNNCSTTASATIADSDSMVVNLVVVHESCPDAADGSIATAITGGQAPYQYNWSTGDTTDVLSGLPVGSYTLTVADALNCSVILVIPIENEGGQCIKIPTAISPNADGSNDVWVIEGLENYPNALVEVYNRWGSLLMTSNDYQNDWDGTYNGDNVAAGVYYFVVTIDEETTYTGSLTVIR